MEFSKDRLKDLTGKMRLCAREVEFLTERVDFESGPNGATDRALRAAKDLHDELLHMEDLKHSIQDMVEAGQS